MSNERLFLGSRRLWIPYDPNGNGRRPDNGKARERLPFSALPSGINFAEFLPSGNGVVKPEHLKEALVVLQTSPGKLIVKASSSTIEELFTVFSTVLQAHHVDHLMIDSNVGEVPLNLLSLVQTAETWGLPLFIMGNGGGTPAEVAQSILGVNVPVALGITDPGLIFQTGFRVLTIS